MHRTVHIGMKENDIRPAELLQRYLALCAEDAVSHFSGDERLDVACGGCGVHDSAAAFEKLGFAYRRCRNCGSVFQSPRPSAHKLEAFYRNSRSSNFWAEVFFPAVAELRRKAIFRPRAEGLAKLCRKCGIMPTSMVDVGAGYGIFLEEWRRDFPAARLIAVEPSSALANVCRNKGLEVIEATAETADVVAGTADLVCCFEVLEHVHDPSFFLQALAAIARPGGYVFLTTLTIDGFDLQVLGERSSQISPPHHINFLSLAGLEALMRRAGLTDIRISTPGRLDADIVRNAVRLDPSLLDGQPFLARVLAEDEAAEAFQRFLVEARMSSHAWVIARKPEGNGG